MKGDGDRGGKSERVEGARGEIMRCSVADVVGAGAGAGVDTPLVSQSAER